MAMIKCPECQKEISDTVTACPNCGCPIMSTVTKTKQETVSPKPEKQPIEKRVGNIAYLILCIIVLITIPYIIKGQINVKQIETFNETIKPYLNVLGTDCSNGEVSVEQYVIDNMNNVILFNIAGEISFHTMGEPKNQIRVVEWTSKKNISDKIFNKFISRLDRVEQHKHSHNYSLRSYKDMSDETYVWYEPIGQLSIACWRDNRKVHINWYYKWNLLE